MQLAIEFGAGSRHMRIGGSETNVRRLFGGLLCAAMSLCAVAVPAAELGFVNLVIRLDHVQVLAVFDDGGIYVADVPRSEKAYEELPNCVVGNLHFALELYAEFDFSGMRSEMPAQSVDAMEVEQRIEEARESPFRYDVVEPNLNDGGTVCYFVAVPDDDNEDLTRLRLLGVVSSVLYVGPAEPDPSGPLMWFRGLVSTVLASL